jgi:hypothetical protein
LRCGLLLAERRDGTRIDPPKRLVVQSLKCPRCGRQWLTVDLSADETEWDRLPKISQLPSFQKPLTIH